MDELISKKAAIEAIEKARANVGHNLERSIGKSIIEILDEVGEDVGKLPSAQLEPSQVARDIARIVENEQDMRILPKRGKWIRISKFPDRVEAYWVTCSACDMRIFGGGKFCPNCGADMRGEQYE